MKPSLCGFRNALLEVKGDLHLDSMLNRPSSIIPMLQTRLAQIECNVLPSVTETRKEVQRLSYSTDPGVDYSICESLFLIHQDVYHDLFVCS